LKDIDNPYKIQVMAKKQRQFDVIEKLERTGREPKVPEQAFVLSLSAALITEELDSQCLLLTQNSTDVPDIIKLISKEGIPKWTVNFDLINIIFI
jgi:hypothetical protein